MLRSVLKHMSLNKFLILPVIAPEFLQRKMDSGWAQVRIQIKLQQSLSKMNKVQINFWIVWP